MRKGVLSILLSSMFLALSSCGSANQKTDEGLNQKGNDDEDYSYVAPSVHTHTIDYIHKNANCFSNGFDIEYCTSCKEYLKQETIPAFHSLDDDNICSICGAKVYTASEQTTQQEIYGYTGYDIIEVNVDKGINLRVKDDVKTLIVRGTGANFYTSIYAYAPLQLILNNVNSANIQTDFSLYIYSTGVNKLYANDGSKGYTGSITNGKGGNGTDGNSSVKAPNVFLYPGACSEITIRGGNGGMGGSGEKAISLHGTVYGDGGNGGNGAPAVTGNLFIDQENDNAIYTHYFGSGGAYTITAGQGGEGGYGYYESWENKYLGSRGQPGLDACVSNNSNETLLKGGDVLDFSSPGDNIEFEAPEESSNATIESACQHHTLLTFIGYEATCLTKGSTDKTVCADCGEVIESPLALPPLGHDYDENGLCSRCGMKRYNTAEDLAKDDPNATIDFNHAFSISANYEKLELHLDSEGYSHKTLIISVPGVSLIHLIGNDRIYDGQIVFANTEDYLDIIFENVDYETSGYNLKYNSIFQLSPNTQAALYFKGTNRIVSTKGDDGANAKDALLGDGDSGGNGANAMSLFDIKHANIYIGNNSSLTAVAGAGGNGGNGGMSSGVFSHDGNGGNGGNGGSVFLGELYIRESAYDNRFATNSLYALTFGYSGFYELTAGSGGQEGKTPSGSLGISGRDGSKGQDGVIANNIGGKTKKSIN